MWRKFWGLVPIERAAALFWFIGDSDWRELVHKFKYGGKWLYALQSGRWLGAELASGGLFDDVDTVIPIPLHWRKRLSRGYNQSEYIARGVAHALGKKCDFHSIRRIKNNPSQAQQHRSERWDNVADIFAVRHAERLRGRDDLRLGIGGHERRDVRRVVWLHVLDDEVVGLPRAKDIREVGEPFPAEVLVNRVEDGHLLVQDNVGIVGHPVRHGVLPLEQVDLVVVDANVPNVF